LLFVRPGFADPQVVYYCCVSPILVHPFWRSCAYKKYGWMDRQMDGQTDGQGDSYITPDFVGRGT